MLLLVYKTIIYADLGLRSYRLNNELNDVKIRKEWNHNGSYKYCLQRR